MNIVETRDELLALTELVSNHDSIWFVMWLDLEKHPRNSNISFISIKVKNEFYVVGLDHVDLLCFDKSDLDDLFNTSGDKYIFQKQKVLHSLKLKGNLYDIDSFHYLNSMDIIDYESYFEHLLNKLYIVGVYDDHIPSIPIMRLTESVQELFKDYSGINTSIAGYEWFNEIYRPILTKLESRGLLVDVEKLIDHYGSRQRKHIKDGRVYTEYNPFTSTGRPSNRHGGVNFAGLNKKDGTRSIFHSGDSVFVHFDFDGYHPRLIGELVDFDFPKTSAHEYLADIYNVDYDEAKSITFRNLYGGIEAKYKNEPFFKETDEFINKHWEQINEDGYIETLYRKILISWIEDVNPQKAFNYLLQAIETEKNIDKLNKIFDIIDGTEIFLILYTYDSFLFEVSNDVDKIKLREIYSVLTEGGYPITYSYGKTYQEL